MYAKNVFGTAIAIARVVASGMPAEKIAAVAATTDVRNIATATSEAQREHRFAEGWNYV